MPSGDFRGAPNFGGAWNAGRDAFRQSMGATARGSRYNRMRGFLRNAAIPNPGKRFGTGQLAMAGALGGGALASFASARNDFRQGRYGRGAMKTAAGGGLGFLAYSYARGNSRPAEALLKRGFGLGSAAKAFFGALR